MKHPLRSLAALTKPEHADWRRAADGRIERLRKGDLAIELRDRDGAPGGREITREALLTKSAPTAAVQSDE